MCKRTLHITQWQRTFLRWKLTLWSHYCLNHTSRMKFVTKIFLLKDKLDRFVFFTSPNPEIYKYFSFPEKRNPDTLTYAQPGLPAVCSAETQPEQWHTDHEWQLSQRTAKKKEEGHVSITDEHRDQT